MRNTSKLGTGGSGGFFGGSSSGGGGDSTLRSRGGNCGAMVALLASHTALYVSFLLLSVLKWLLEMSTALSSCVGKVKELDLGLGAGAGWESALGGRSGGVLFSKFFLRGGGRISQTSGMESDFVTLDSILSPSSLVSSLLLSLLQHENMPFRSTVGYSIT